MARGVKVPCPHADDLPGRRVVCDACLRERDIARCREYNRKHRDRHRERDRRRYREDPEKVRERAREWYWANRERKLAADAAWKAAHPEKQRGYRQAYLERVRSDPVAYARHLETQRMAARLAAERKGRPLRPVPEDRYPAASTAWRMPAEPLRALVRQWDGTLTELAEQSGVSERLLGRLLNGKGEVTVAAADRLATAAGLHIDLIADEAGL